MRKILFLFSLLLCLNALPAFALDYIDNKIPNAKEVGKGRLTYMVWDIYDATLYAPNGQLDKTKPFALNLTYLRDLKGKKIAERSVVEMRRLGIKNEVKLATWFNQMQNIFPDVTEGVTLTGLYQPDGTSVFYKNGAELGHIKDKEFSEYFFDIWLDKNTSAPDLRASLLGLE